MVEGTGMVHHRSLQLCEMVNDFLVGVHSVLICSQPLEAFDNLAHSDVVHFVSPSLSLNWLKFIATFFAFGFASAGLMFEGDYHRLSPCYDIRIPSVFLYLVLTMQNKRAWTVVAQALVHIVFMLFCWRGCFVSRLKR